MPDANSGKVHGTALSPAKIRDLRGSLLVWYDRNARDLPWRRTHDPYIIWVSEIMLQQTRVSAVVEYFQRFIKRFPDMATLATAREDEVLALWSGLGYYRRARMLHRAAQFVAAELGGRLPGNSAELRSLPGIGDYTAAAVASIGFGERIAVVDGNVQRVLTRLAGLAPLSVRGRTADEVAKPLGSDKRGPHVSAAAMQALAQQLVDRRRPGDFNQAMMELGATLCLPTGPHCLVCPVSRYCATRGEHAAAPRAAMLSRRADYAFIARVRRGTAARINTYVLLEHRADSLTLMPGMWELPPIPDGASPAGAHPVLSLRHAITNTNYYVRVFDMPPPRGKAASHPHRRWFTAAELPDLPLTGLARKALKRLKVWPGYAGDRLPVLLPNADLGEIVL